MKNADVNINIRFGTGHFEYSGAFNAFSIRHLGDIILFAFILKDINGSILKSSSYSIYASSLRNNRDAFWRYLSSKHEPDEEFNESTFVFSDVRNIEIIHANSNQDTSEITLGAFSLLHLTRAVDVIKKNKSNIPVFEYENAFIVSIFKSNPIVHKAFIKKILDVLESIPSSETK